MATTPGVHSPLELAISTSVFARALDDAHFEALAGSAIRAVEIVGPTPSCAFDEAATRDRLRRALPAAGVRLHSVHLPYGSRLDLSQPDDAARRGAVEATALNLHAAAALGAALAVVHPSAEPIADEARAVHLDASRRSLEALTPLALDLGVKLAVECLPRTCLANTASELAALLDGLDPRAIGACVDVNHLNLREPDLEAALCVLAPRLATLHCSDNDGIDERHWLPGAEGGVIDWGAFIAGLRAARYEGPFLYELRPLGVDPAEAVREIERNFGDHICPLFTST